MIENFSYSDIGYQKLVCAMVYELLLQAGLVEVLFHLNIVKKTKISIIKDSLDITQHSLYASIEKLDANGFVIDDKQPTQRIIKITEKGELLAKKLSYLFDETKETVPLPKEQYNLLKKVLEDQQEGEVENFVLNSVLEKLKKHSN